MIAIITLILNLLLGAPAENQTATTTSTTTTMSADSEEQALETMGGSGGWANSTKD